MATNLVDAVQELLEADAPVVALLTGGVYTDTATVAGGMSHPIGPTRTPAAFETSAGGIKRLKPCALVAPNTVQRAGPGKCFAREYVRVAIYQETGFATVRAAARAVRDALDGARVELDDGRWLLIEWEDDPTLDGEDPSLVVGDGKRPASMCICRYSAVTGR